ncbi:Cof-type HAD-IIB family hydrolase [Streptacidiphilus rugosus]|uniref:Cof-type HAD-IIB family hydrolase n=1 Tax=Streptacidiphilus rugosus TaxID=405783 RepID=UPI00068CC7C1|nr:HAD family hydrolase [Streptacidiphilus rugosus]
MLPSLIATDLDGTLLRSDGTVSARTEEALRRAEEAGVCIVFVTGRPPRWMDAVSTAIGPHGVAICSNGGALYDVRRKELLETHPMRADDALATVGALRKALPEVSFAFEYPAGFSHEPAYPRTLWDMDAADQVAPAEEILAGPAGHQIFKLLAKHPDIDPDEFLRRGRELVGDFGEVTRSAAVPMLEISAPGVTKAAALAAWCGERGIIAERVLAFGDMPNDLPMLAWAGTAYAVANAHPEVLAATPRHTTDHDTDGVARVIESLL